MNQDNEQGDIDAQEYARFLADYRRFGEIALARQRQLWEITKLERTLADPKCRCHPDTWHFADQYGGETQFAFIEPDDGSAQLRYYAYERQDNEHYEVSNEELTDPDFWTKTEARLAELTAQIAQRQAQIAADEAAKAAAAAAAERELYESLRRKYEIGSQQPS